MKIIESLEAIRSDRPTAVTLGKFDGLHRAHQILIGNVVRIGNKKGFCPVSVSFDLSPVRILTKKEKEQRLEEAGIGMMIRLPFTAEIMTMEADYFIEEILRGKLHASYVCVGDDFRFVLDSGEKDTVVQLVSFAEGAPTVAWRDVRPLPEGGGFFENVWREYRKHKNIY